MAEQDPPAGQAGFRGRLLLTPAGGSVQRSSAVVAPNDTSPTPPATLRPAQIRTQAQPPPLPTRAGAPTNHIPWAPPEADERPTQVPPAKIPGFDVVPEVPSSLPSQLPMDAPTGMMTIEQHDAIVADLHQRLEEFKRYEATAEAQIKHRDDAAVLHLKQVRIFADLFGRVISILTHLIMEETAPSKRAQLTQMLEEVKSALRGSASYHPMLGILVAIYEQSPAEDLLMSQGHISSHLALLLSKLRD